MKDTIQEQVAAARRTQILEAAKKVFAEKGFHVTTIRDIAKVAGIADGTIYNYFENKTALLLGILDRMTAIATQDALQPDLATHDLKQFIRAYLWHPLMALKADNFELFRVIISEIMVNPELRARYYEKLFLPGMTMAEQVFGTLTAQGTMRAVNIPLVLRAIFGMVLGLIAEHIMGDPQLQSAWEDIPDLASDMLVNGLKADK